MWEKVYEDKKDLYGWLELNLKEVFVDILMIVIWIFLCLYVVVNFG